MTGAVELRIFFVSFCMTVGRVKRATFSPNAWPDESSDTYRANSDAILKSMNSNHPMGVDQRDGRLLKTRAFGVDKRRPQA